MAVGVTWCVEQRLLDEAAVVGAVTAALAHGGRAGIDVDVILVDDPTLADLHARFLGDPSVTDVMSFDLGEDGGGPAGELYVSVDRAVAVATARGVRPARELALYLVHGALHLCGHDDHEDDERAAMRAAEAAVLAELGYEADTAPHDAP
ncbi:MAG: rRNA maturation RNase YbeY [Planctomycetota bacterium]